MLFFYHDLPKVHASNAENASHYSINPNENSAERKPLFSEASGVLTDTSTTDDVGKQKLIINNFTVRRSHKRSRTSSVMENWHLVSG